MYSWFIGFQSTMMLRYGVLLTSSKRQTNQLTLDVLQTERRAYAQKASIKPTRGQSASHRQGTLWPMEFLPQAQNTMLGCCCRGWAAGEMVMMPFTWRALGTLAPSSLRILQHSRKHQQRLLRVLIWLFNVWKI